jgi:hypothetical protein
LDQLPFKTLNNKKNKVLNIPLIIRREEVNCKKDRSLLITTLNAPIRKYTQLVIANKNITERMAK